MKRLYDNDGMSLIEITFAMAILATALSLLFGSLISITIIGRLNEQKAQAQTELSSTLEDLRELPLVDLLEYVPESPAHPGVERAIALECFDGNGASVPLPMALVRDPVTGVLTGPLPDLPNPLEVKATLLWKNERGHVFKLHATTSVGR